MTRTHRVWASRVRAEHRSAAATADLLQRMITAGAPDDLLRVALRIVGDELDHAQLCHKTLVGLGGDGDAVEVEPTLRRGPASLEELLPSILRTVLKVFCFGETLAVPFFAEMRKNARGPARPTLDRIVRDEAVHSKFGWDSLDWLLELGGEDLRPAIGAMLPELVQHFEGVYAQRVAEDLSPAELRAGLLSASRYRKLCWRTVNATILPRMKARGIVVPEETP